MTDYTYTPMGRRSICPRCGEELTANMVNCPYCGLPTAPAQNGSPFCEKCGNKLNEYGTCDHCNKPFVPVGAEPLRQEDIEPPYHEGIELPRYEGIESPRYEGIEPPRREGIEPLRYGGVEPPRYGGMEPSRYEGIEPPRTAPMYGGTDGTSRKYSEDTVKKIIAVSIVVLVIVGLFWFSSYYNTTILPQKKYEQAQSLVLSGGYIEAYRIYDELGAYKSSTKKKETCVYAWAESILKNNSIYEVDTFKTTVYMDNDYYEKIYTLIMDKIVINPDYEYWWGESFSRIPAKTVYAMLELLPPSYKDVSYLLQLFDAIQESEERSKIVENRLLLEELWHIELVRNIVTDDSYVKDFLKGHWSGSYYITFYENDEGGISSTYTLPWVAEPAGTKYYDICDMTYVYTDGSNELAKVYKFTLTSIDSMDVYCYKNGRTYRVTR